MQYIKQGAGTLNIKIYYPIVYYLYCNHMVVEKYGVENGRFFFEKVECAQNFYNI
jgi:hypothetical protein